MKSPIDADFSTDVIAIAVDPGAQAGLTLAWSDDGRTVQSVCWSVVINSKARAKMPYWEILPHLKKPKKFLCLVLEKCQARPPMGLKSAFNFGRTYQRCFDFLNGFADHWNGVSGFGEVVPQVWQKFFGLKRDKKSGLKMKDLSLQKAHEVGLSPEIKDHNVADSVLLARYALAVSQAIFKADKN